VVAHRESRASREFYADELDNSAKSYWKTEAAAVVRCGAGGSPSFATRRSGQAGLSATTRDGNFVEDKGKMMKF